MNAIAERGIAKLGVCFAAALCIFGQQPARAVEVIVNGGFETGTFAGWTVTNRAGGSGSWFIDTPGTTTPLSGSPTSAAGGLPHGSFYGVTDQNGPGTHVLRQNFDVAPGSSVTLSFDWFVNDQSGAGPIFGAQGLDHNGAANQHARVDILTGGSGAFDTGATVLANFYLGVDPGANPNDFTHYLFDITGVVGGGGVFDLRYAEVDNQFFLNAGVDNVSINAVTAAVPEPGSLALLAVSLGAFAFSRRRKLA